MSAGLLPAGTSASTWLVAPLMTVTLSVAEFAT